jgi:hypothetical protein
MKVKKVRWAETGGKGLKGLKAGNGGKVRHITLNSGDVLVVRAL